MRWAITRLSAGPLSARFAEFQIQLQTVADAEVVLESYRAITASLVRAANYGVVAAERRGVSHPGVRRAAQRVRAKVAESLSLDELASELQMSKCHMARCFERALGVPPHRYRKLLRLQAARRLLEAGLSVGDAASETGFADAPHLTRAFREWLGVSPAAWGSAWRASDPWSKQSPQTIVPAGLD